MMYVPDHLWFKSKESKAVYIGTVLNVFAISSKSRSQELLPWGNSKRLMLEASLLRGVNLFSSSHAHRKTGNIKLKRYFNFMVFRFIIKSSVLSIYFVLMPDYDPLRWQESARCKQHLPLPSRNFQR